MILRITVLAVLTVTALPVVAEQRVPWTTSRIVGSPDPPKPYHVERVYPRLEFRNPVELMTLADTGKMMLLEVGGKLYTFEDDPDVEQAELALDLKPRIDEFKNALGFGVHPRFSENRQVFVVYTGGPVARADGTRLSRFVLDEQSPPRIDPESEEVLMTWHSGGHNGCAIRFDSQGYLYCSLGDGARPFPPDEYNVSQDLSDLRATICRIDVDRRDGDKPYAIPPDNPFIDIPDARPEIWAYGFRNPWRFTIDPRSDRLLCGDVGWELWELVFDVRRGGNYGWSIVEGPQPIRSDIEPGPTPIRKPLVAYPHAVGQSVTGGIVYRGNQHAELDGAFLYGDYVTGLLWGVRQAEEQVTWNPVIAETGLQIITIAESRDREALIVDYGGGIYRLVTNPDKGEPSRFPRRLSETGLYTSTQPLRPAPGVLEYDLAAESSQRGAVSKYVVAVPGERTISVNARQRSWNHPAGTVFARTFSTPEDTSSSQKSLKLETQVLHFNGIKWQPYSYAWNREQTDAELVDAEGGEVDWLADVGGESAIDEWPIRNRAQCRVCHSRQSGGAIGFSLANLDHPSSSADGENQLDRLLTLGILDRRPPKQWNIQPMVDPQDPAASLDLRARSYLAANCGGCHSRGGGGTVPLDLSFANATEEINAIDVLPTQGDFGIEPARVIDPGDPYRSVLFYRLVTSGAGHMPKLASHDNDPRGLRLIHDWILSLDPKPSADLKTSTEAASSVDVDEAVLDTSAALMAFCRLMFVNEDPQQRLQVANAAMHRGNIITAGIFERFLPADQRRKRLGDQVNADEILAMRGDPVRGRELFTSPQVVQCVNCHRLAGSGHSVGPDLDAIASQRTREQLLTSILKPSAAIEPAYNSYLALTSDGAVVSGLKVIEDQQSMTLRGADGKDRRILRGDIDSLKVQSQSLMPEGLAAGLTAQELADLLAFLESLR